MSEHPGREERLALLPNARRMCQACEEGRHSQCGMQTWCECEDGRDGDPNADDSDDWDGWPPGMTEQGP